MNIYLIMGRYVSSHHLVLPSADQKVVRYEWLKSLVSFSIFAVSIGLAFLNPQLAKLMWVTIFLSALLS